MSHQKFSAKEREAIWSAHHGKCAYTQESLDVSSFHIDHVIPENLVDDPSKLEILKIKFGLPVDFNIFGYENLLPSSPGANMQKGSLLLETASIHYFLSIAANKKAEVGLNIERIEKRNTRGKALVLLQQCLERGDLDVSEIEDILEKHSDKPMEIFQLLEAMKFVDATEVRSIVKTDIEGLRDRPIRLGQNANIDGVTLTNDNFAQVQARTCREYDDAVKSGYRAYSTFDMKIATFFEHHTGLPRALERATTAKTSFIQNPRVGIVDLELLPFSLFPQFGEKVVDGRDPCTYQSKVSDGSFVITKLRQNLIQVSEPEGMGHQLIEVARADFNGDGFEDILLFEYCWATHGTLGYGGVRILTRRSADGLFEDSTSEAFS